VHGTMALFQTSVAPGPLAPYIKAPYGKASYTSVAPYRKAALHTRFTNIPGAFVNLVCSGRAVLRSASRVQPPPPGRTARPRSATPSSPPPPPGEAGLRCGGDHSAR
jgi:hypothetical protein